EGVPGPCRAGRERGEGAVCRGDRHGEGRERLRCGVGVALTVIPGRAKREPGIHSSASDVDDWLRAASGNGR
ncbi:hypothetical protein ACSTI4_24125, partial [Vibrio parahaemolyticus]